MILRQKGKIHDTDDLGQVLWRCGLAPGDSDTRERSWEILARALGGSGNTRSAVLERLRARAQFATEALVDDLPPGVVPSCEPEPKCSLGTRMVVACTARSGRCLLRSGGEQPREGRCWRTAAQCRRHLIPGYGRWSRVD